MKQAKYSLNLFTIVLFVILNIASSITLASEDTQKPDQPTVSQRRYSPMSVEEARQLVEKHIKNKDVPPPPSSSLLGMSFWELPETSLYAQGIKINDNDYVIFAQGKSTILLYLPKGNLSEFLPKIPTSATDKDIVGPFYLNGIIFSTVDLEVVNNLTFRQGGGGGLEQSKSLKKVDICGI